MPLTLQADNIVELAWWWEDPPRGRLLDVRDVSLVRSLVGRWLVRAGQAQSLRSFLARGEAPVLGRVEDDELFERIAVSIARGKIRVAITSREPLIAWDGEEEEAPSGERVVAAKTEPAVADVDECIPCKKAREAREAAQAMLIGMTSARALRNAAENGTPFIVDW